MISLKILSPIYNCMKLKKEGENQHCRDVVNQDMKTFANAAVES